LTYRAIGERLGITHPAAYQHVKAAIREIAEQSADTAEEIINLEVERIDRALLALEAKIQDGDTKAIEVMIKLQDRRARYFGLDSPTKIAPTTPDGVSEWHGMEPEALAAHLAAMANQIKETNGG
jgi:hypothetical protein